MLRIASAITLAIVATATTGCAWQQGYLATQGWQRNQCYGLVDQTERDRCLGSTAMGYDDYRRQTEVTDKQ